MNAILTDKDFEIFVSKAKHWIRYLGLTDYDWEFEFEDKPQKKAKRAAEIWIYSDNRPKRVDIKVYKNWGGEIISEETLSKTALHEVLHVVIAEAKIDEENTVTMLMNAINGI